MSPYCLICYDIVRECWQFILLYLYIYITDVVFFSFCCFFFCLVSSFALFFLIIDLLIFVFVVVFWFQLIVG